VRTVDSVPMVCSQSIVRVRCYCIGLASRVAALASFNSGGFPCRVWQSASRMCLPVRGARGDAKRDTVCATTTPAAPKNEANKINTTDQSIVPSGRNPTRCSSEPRAAPPGGGRFLPASSLGDFWEAVSCWGLDMHEGTGRGNWRIASR
jgi:hypothetical protein